MIDPALVELMTDTVTIEPWTGQTTTGTATYGAGVTYRARVQMMDEIKRALNGREQLGRGKVYVAMTTIPSTKDRLTLSAGYDPPQPAILDVQPENDDAGDINHVVLILG